MNGDLNGDGSINAIDYSVMRRYILEGTGNISLEAADVDESGIVNALDYSLMRRYMLRLIEQF